MIPNETAVLAYVTAAVSLAYCAWQNDVKMTAVFSMFILLTSMIRRIERAATAREQIEESRCSPSGTFQPQSHARTSAKSLDSTNMGGSGTVGSSFPQNVASTPSS